MFVVGPTNIGQDVFSISEKMPMADCDSKLKMTGETPEVRSDKREKREVREEKKEKLIEKRERERKRETRGKGHGAGPTDQLTDRQCKLQGCFGTAKNSVLDLISS